jgi:Asp-tRNA(Asn)/Glu-tRNA(Gln) amidotransferase A subunit family amidase
VCQLLYLAGFKLKPVAAFKDFDEIELRHNLIVASEAARVHASWFSQFESLYHAKTAELIQRGQDVSNPALKNAQLGRERLRNELQTLMDEHGLDVWVSPSAPGPASKGLDSTGNPVMNLPWTHAGLPTLNLPSGKNSAGLPLGLQVSGRWYEDEKLFIWGKHLETALAYQYPQ